MVNCGSNVLLLLRLYPVVTIHLFSACPVLPAFHMPPRFHLHCFVSVLICSLPMRNTVAVVVIDGGPACQLHTNAQHKKRCQTINRALGYNSDTATLKHVNSKSLPSSSCISVWCTAVESSLDSPASNRCMRLLSSLCAEIIWARLDECRRRSVRFFMQTRKFCCRCQQSYHKPPAIKNLFCLSSHHPLSLLSVAHYASSAFLVNNDHACP